MTLNPFNNIASVAFVGRNMATSVYEVDDKYQSCGHVFLSLKFAGQDFPPTVTIAFSSFDNQKTANAVEIGDKIEFTPARCFRNGDEIRRPFFEHERPALLVSSIKFWKSNVVSFDGWKNINQTQTRFAPRAF